MSRRPRFHEPYSTGELLVWRRAFIDDVYGNPSCYAYRRWRERCCPVAPDLSTIFKHFGSWAEFLARPPAGREPT